MFNCIIKVITAFMCLAIIAVAVLNVIHPDNNLAGRFGGLVVLVFAGLCLKITRYYFSKIKNMSKLEFQKKWGTTHADD